MKWEFKEVSENPGVWFVQARAFEATCGALLSAILEQLRRGVGAEEQLLFMGNVQTMHLLAAYAIENACKGVLVAKREIRVVEGRLRLADKTHNIPRLVERAGVKYPNIVLLEILEQVARWAGRYGTSIRQEDYNPDALKYAIECFKACEEIVNQAEAICREYIESKGGVLD